MRGKELSKPVEKRVIVVLVDDQPNVLARVSSLIGRRNYNIHTLTATETDIPGITRITAVVSGNEYEMHQIVSQLEKLENVRQVDEIERGSGLYRELLLVKVAVDKVNRGDIRDIADIYRAKIIDLSPKSMIMELTGSSNKIDVFLDVLSCYEIMEVCRTGTTGIERDKINNYDINLKKER